MQPNLLIQLFLIPSNFDAFLSIYNQHYDPNREPNYRQLVQTYRNTNDYRRLLNDAHIRLCYDALGHEFGLAKRRAKLVPFSAYASSILAQKQRLWILSKYRLEQFKSGQVATANLFGQLSALFRGLNVMASGSQLVGVSKTLHFLLPDLIMPVDRENVLEFLYGSRYVPVSIDTQFSRFTEVLNRYTDFAQRLSLTLGNGGGNWWNTSVPKRIDNAIAGLLFGVKNGMLRFDSADQ